MTTTLRVTQVTATSPAAAGRPLKLGDTLALTLATNESIDGLTLGVGATQPSLSLSNGGTATFTGYDAAGLHFAYTVQAGQDAVDLQVSGLLLNGTGVSHVAFSGFASPTRYTAGNGSTAPSVADVNGDGIPDIITVNASGNTVSVLLGQAGGGFASRTDYAVGSFPTAVSVGDVNGDGRSDIVAVNFYSNTVSVLLGQVGGGFSSKTDYAVGGAPLRVAVLDVDGDGHLDIVTANVSSRTVSVLLGQAGGGFAARTDYATGSRPYGLAVADVNGDGRPDILIANDQDNSVSVLLGQAGGGFAAKIDYAVGRTPTSMAVADVNGDGRSDIVAANSSDDTVSVLLGQAGGGFAAKTDYAVGSGPGSVVVADVNGDGRSDIVTANAFDGTVSVLLGQAGGGFAAKADFAIGNSSGDVAVADLDGDGHLDIVATNSSGNTVSVLRGLYSSAATLDVTSLSTASGRDTGLVIDATAPSGTSLTPSIIAPSNAASTIYAVHFSEAVTGVDAADFALASTGTAGGTIAGVSDTGNHQDYTVTVSGITGTGSLALALAAGATITDIAGNAATLTASTAHAVDRDAPMPVLSGVSGLTNREGGHVISGDLGAGDAGLAVTIRDGASVLGTTIADAQGHFSLAFTDTKPGASHGYNLTASATDAAGNTATSDSFAFAFDYTPNQSLFGTVAHDATSHAGQVYALYDALFARAPDAAGAEAWTDYLDHTGSLRELTQILLDSPEGRSHLNASDNAGFVEQLYGTALGRGSDAPGKAGWVAYLDAGGSRADLADQFALSSENLGQLQPAFQAGVFVADAEASQVARLYHGLLDRTPDATGFAGWVAARHAGLSELSATQAFLDAPEYAASFAGQSDTAFLAHLYDGALGRSPDQAGLAHWQAALDAGQGWATVAMAVLDSTEAQAHWAPAIQTGWHIA